MAGVLAMRLEVQDLALCVTPFDRRDWPAFSLYPEDPPQSPIDSEFCDPQKISRNRLLDIG